MTTFLQTPPRLSDAWASDRMLREALQFYLGDATFRAAEPELAAMGRVATDPQTLALARRAELEPPVHTPYSAWGERIDEIRVSDAYLELGRIGIEAGVTALPYEDTPYGSKARLVWGALIALWSPSSAFYGCPVAMTDAAARTLLEHGDVDDMPVVQRLTTRAFDQAWSSGQWMTETAGGSDVSRTGTVARRDAAGRWYLSGTKWFTSATTSEMALTLARPAGGPDSATGLALFRIHRHLDSGERNSITVRRLKDKLGTRALPTAELELEAALAHPVGDPYDGGGVRRIATMLNLTRIHNSLGAVGSMARGLAWARAHAQVRQVFGRPLHAWPAHRATLADLAVDYAAALALTLRCCELTGKSEHAEATDPERSVLRGLTPVTKLATGRWAVASAGEAMEAIGGVGYCEDSTIPTLVRDAHVLPIWEGTTNVLALDLLRAEQRHGAIAALLQDAHHRMSSLSDDAELVAAAGQVQEALRELARRAREMAADAEVAQAHARSFAIGVARTYACALLCEQGLWAAKQGDRRTLAAALRLAERGLLTSPPRQRAFLRLAMDEPELEMESSLE